MGLMISRSEDKAIWFGGSVAGPAHREAGVANQDAWVCIRWLDAQRRPIYCAAVCDGLGSRSEARAGALAGVRAAKWAARQWARAPGAPVGLLVRLLEVLWRLEVAPSPAGDCAATSLVVLILPEENASRLVVMTLGDSLAVIETPDRLLTFGGRSEGNFGNETLGLGTPHHMDDWQVLDLRTAGHLRVLLLSDGIADDVPKENLAELAKWVAEFEARPPHARGKALRRALERWPVPGHTDDKTLVYLRVEGMGNS